MRAAVSLSRARLISSSSFCSDGRSCPRRLRAVRLRHGQAWDVAVVSPVSYSLRASFMTRTDSARSNFTRALTRSDWSLSGVSSDRLNFASRKAHRRDGDRVETHPGRCLRPSRSASRASCWLRRGGASCGRSVASSTLFAAAAGARRIARAPVGAGLRARPPCGARRRQSGEAVSEAFHQVRSGRRALACSASCGLDAPRSGPCRPARRLASPIRSAATVPARGGGTAAGGAVGRQG